MTLPILRIKDISFTYPLSGKGLHKINIDIHKGESVALIGENGAGKSTLLQTIIGFLKPSSGEIHVENTRVLPRTIQTIRRCIGMVFQDPDDQLFMPTVYDDVAFGPLNIGMNENEINTTVTESLQRVNALHLKDRQPHHLSGGEKRTVAIAGVLAMSPSILLMDEPSSHLDPQSRQHLIELLQSLPQTKIIATHDLDMALDVCERTIVLHRGQVHADAPSRDIFSDTKLLHACGLKQPLSKIF